MLRLPIYGFAWRVDDAVARAMTILTDREDYTAKPRPLRISTPAPKPRRTRFGYEE
jgi:hypothetical protein